MFLQTLVGSRTPIIGLFCPSIISCYWLMDGCLDNLLFFGNMKPKKTRRNRVIYTSPLYIIVSFQFYYSGIYIDSLNNRNSNKVLFFVHKVHAPKKFEGDWIMRCCVYVSLWIVYNSQSSLYYTNTHHYQFKLNKVVKEEDKEDRK